MTQAWQAHEAAQQKLIEDLLQRAHDKADEIEPYEKFMVELMTEIMIELRHEMSGGMDDVVLSEDAKSFLDQAVTPAIKRFARVPSERRVLLWKFYTKIEESVAVWVTREYREHAMANPVAAYGAPSATTDIRKA